ncbi:Glutamate--tRNA ligase [Planctomycetes bacterium Pla163]|uniref:Glutamate--tRNA ligase n=1 Tax=Rohdeia mirabilis TaxID=2528008 RepID=A0A518CZ50_9BACT|nr:Glutamate--tRNA ligase [Planctomycetes bacterium Pla163]
MTTVRTRFAPSPTGALHIGGARTALFNWAFARGRGGRFVLRVEDTDPERSKREYEDAILDGFRWLGIDWDEGPDVGGPFAPYRQSERAGRHLERAHELVAKGLAYRCFATAEELGELRAGQEARKETLRYDGRYRTLDAAEAERRAAAGEAHTIRFRVPDQDSGGETVFDDSIRGRVRFSHAEVEDWIMVRTDGSPTYNFVCVCDDADMQITHVVRGEEHLVNTPKQILLFRALGLEPPVYAHLPLILGTDGKKMSKRTGDTALEAYRVAGHPPEAVVNFLCLQGWALDGEREVFDRSELVEHFDVKDVSKGGSIFDPDKLAWLSGEYLRAEPLEQTLERAAPFLAAAGLLVDGDLEERADFWRLAIESIRERVRLYAEIPAKLAFLFAPDSVLPWDAGAEAKTRANAGAADVLEGLASFLADLPDERFRRATLADELKQWCASQGHKLGAVFQPLRTALTGEPGGPELADVLVLLGRGRSVARLTAAVGRLRAS